MAAINQSRLKLLPRRRKAKALAPERGCPSRSVWPAIDALKSIPGRKVWQRHYCRPQIFRYITAVNYLTRQEQMFLLVVLGLLLTGWAVKTYRLAHPATVAVQPAKP
jgi:hypothetical protein